MIRKNKLSTSYIDNPLNRSPSKETHKFRKAERFVVDKKFSPDKFYDIPDTLEKRAISFGYGKKVDIVLKELNDPGKTVLRTEFDEITQGYRFGTRPPARQAVRKDYSCQRLREPLERSFNNKQSRERKTWSKSRGTSPIKDAKEQKSSFNERHRTKRLFNQEDSKPPQPRQSAKQLKYEYSQNFLLGNNRTSYYEFLNSKKQSPPKQTHQNLTNVTNLANHTNLSHNRSAFRLEQRPLEQATNKYHQHSTFGREERMVQRQRLSPALGPGAYHAFSQFGEDTQHR